MSIDPRVVAFPWPSIAQASQMLVDRIYAANHSLKVAA